MSGLSLSPQNVKEDTGPQIKRLNKLPVVIAISVGVVFICVLAWGLSNRGIYGNRDTGIDIANGAPATDFADQLKRGVADGVIGEPRPILAPLLPVPPSSSEDTPSVPPAVVTAPKPSEPALEPEAQWLERLEREEREYWIRQKHQRDRERLQIQEAALTGPMALDVSRVQASQAASSRRAGAPSSDSYHDGMPGEDKMLDLYARAMQGEGSGPLDPNGQAKKKAFLEQTIGEVGYLAKLPEVPRSMRELKRGSVIPATLITGLNSDLPGHITAQVRQNVYDSATGHYLLIPQGSKLLGRYDSDISFGQSRVLAVWTDLIFPDGSTLQLEGMGGVDASGASGFHDKVNRKWLQTFGSAALVAVIGAGVDLMAPKKAQAFSPAQNAADSLRQNAADTFGRMAEQTISRNMDVQPTLTIRPGYIFNVIVEKDIIVTR